MNLFVGSYHLQCMPFVTIQVKWEDFITLPIGYSGPRSLGNKSTGRCRCGYPAPESETGAPGACRTPGKRCCCTRGRARCLCIRSAAPPSPRPPRGHAPGWPPAWGSGCAACSWGKSGAEVSISVYSAPKTKNVTSCYRHNIIKSLTVCQQYCSTKNTSRAKIAVIINPFIIPLHPFNSVPRSSFALTVAFQPTPFL